MLNGEHDHLLRRLDAVSNPPHDEQPPRILTKLHRLAIDLQISAKRNESNTSINENDESRISINENDEPNTSKLCQIITEIHDLSFMSGTKHYDNIRKDTLIYLKENQECHEPLLQHILENDQNKFQEIMKELTNSGHLSLTQMDKYHAFLDELTNTSEGAYNTEQFKKELARKLLSDLPSLNEKIINSFDARRRLTKLEGNVITETIDLFNQTETKEGKTQEIYCSIDDLIDKLHYTSRLYSLLNRCYPSLHLMQRISKNQCNQLTQCDTIYQDLRSQLLKLCASTDDKQQTIWAENPIVRQINHTWIERYINQPHHDTHAKNFLSTGATCPISLQSFGELAPTVDQADNLCIFDADNCLYGKKPLMLWAKSQNSLPNITSQASRVIGNINDVVTITNIINIEQFTIRNLLPETLPLNFIPQEAEAT